jgi:hypothetical protein
METRGTEIVTCPNNTMETRGTEIVTCPNNTMETRGTEIVTCPNFRLQLTPKFIAFKGPSQRRQVLAQGLITFEPADYVDVFKDRGVTSVVQPPALNPKP